MKIAICDDDARDSASLRALTEEYLSGSGAISVYGSAVGLLEDYANGKRYDLVFLDIQMAVIDGYSAAEQLFKRYRDELPLIIFVTVTDDYVFTGYDVRAFGYFPKPVDKCRLFKKLDQANDELLGNTIAVKSGSDNLIIPTKEIKYIVSDNNKTTIVANSGKYPVRMTMAEIIKILPKQKFVRSHRSFIVNLERVKRYDDHNAYFENSSDDVAYISRKHRKAFISALDEYLRR